MDKDTREEREAVCIVGIYVWDGDGIYSCSKICRHLRRLCRDR